MRLFDDRLECFLGPDPVMRMTRVRTDRARGHAIDYHHLIGTLRRKAQALRYLVYREALFPRAAYARAWIVLDDALSPRDACRTMVALLVLASTHEACEIALASRLDAILDAGQLPDIAKLEKEFASKPSPSGEVTIPAPNLQAYDRLLPSACEATTDATMADADFLASLLTELRLPSIARNWRRIAEAADRDGWPAQKTIAALMEIEVAERASRRIQRHRDQSEAPAGKTFASFDFDVAPGVRKQQLLSLGAGGDWIRNGDNLLLFGKSGTGKSHAMAAVCHALIDAGKRVLFTRTIDIVQRLQTARRDLSLIDALEKLDKFDLIVLDDLSYVRKDQAETSVLFELIAHRYERHSIAITANQAFSAWNTVFPDAATTAAAVDRLVHHATIIEMNGESYRERSAACRAAKEETPDLA